jgi:hypothetical protein
MREVNTKPTEKEQEKQSVYNSVSRNKKRFGLTSTSDLWYKYDVKHQCFYHMHSCSKDWVTISIISTFKKKDMEESNNWCIQTSNQFWYRTSFGFFNVVFIWNISDTYFALIAFYLESQTTFQGFIKQQWKHFEKVPCQGHNWRQYKYEDLNLKRHTYKYIKNVLIYIEMREYIHTYHHIDMQVQLRHSRTVMKA